MTHDLKFFRPDYHHDDQVRLCARHLEVLRDDMGAAWWEWSNVKGGADLRKSGGGTTWSSERAILAAHLIRHASESADFPATVDFITRDAHSHIEESKAKYRRRSIGHLTQWDLFTHEHMVPGAAALTLLTDPNFEANRGPLFELLSGVSFRALVTGTKRKREKGMPNKEVGALDALFASRLPKPHEVSNWSGPTDPRKISPKFYGLMRYDAAGLIDELIPVSVRARALLQDYKTRKSGSL